MIKKTILLLVAALNLQGCSNDEDMVKYYTQHHDERQSVLKRCKDGYFFKMFNKNKCRNAEAAAQKSFWDIEEPGKNKTYKTFKGGSQ